jgi:hypothetical protein
VTIDAEVGYKAIVSLDAIQSPNKDRSIYQFAKLMEKDLDYEQLYALKQIMGKNSSPKFLSLEREFKDIINKL